ncbi:putative J domain-containing protein C17A3.05c [Hordeum vulgare]|nr:putative J domain-containing protein C17A3.05c [Hordeum vulgare]
MTTVLGSLAARRTQDADGSSSLNYNRKKKRRKNNFPSNADLNGKEIFDDNVTNVDRQSIWALFDNLDGVPRYYAKIKGFDASNFKVHLTWLERIAMNEAEEKWSDEELHVACGSFSLETTNISQDRLMFSHIVSWKANGGNMKYIRVRMRIEGFVSLFVTVKEKSDIVVAPSELLRFSQSVPFYRTNGNGKVATAMPRMLTLNSWSALTARKDCVSLKKKLKDEKALESHESFGSLVRNEKKNDVS